MNIDSARSEGEDPLDEQSWAQDGVNNANLVQPPQSGTEQPTEANLLAEAKGVVATEDSTLLTADINDLESDPDYGDQICAALTLLNNAIKAFTIDPTNVPQVVSYLQGLASSNNPAPDDLASVFNDAANKFDSVFPTCGGTLDVTTWLIDQIQSLFCPNS